MKAKLVRESLNDKLKGPDYEEVKRKVKEDPEKAFNSSHSSEEIRDLARSYMPDLPEDFERILKEKGFVWVDNQYTMYVNVHPKTLYKVGEYEQEWIGGINPDVPEEITFSLLYGAGLSAMWYWSDKSEFERIYQGANKIIKNMCNKAGVDNVYDLRGPYEDEIAKLMKVNFSKGAEFTS